MNTGLKVRFRLFANLREAAETEFITVQVPEHTSVQAAFAVAGKSHPELNAWQGRVAFARGSGLVHGNAEVTPDDQLDALPPVSGG